MNLTSLKAIKALCKKYQISPSKGLGQNFLVNKFALKKLTLTAEIQPKDTILEIGPGIGTLTQELAKKAKRVIAVEKDQRMVEVLRETLSNFKNVEIVQGDILKLNPMPYLPRREAKLLLRGTLKAYKVVANLPFYLTAPLIRKFLELTEVRPLLMVFIVQKEVAQRICAKPPRMNLLAVSVQFYAQPKIISHIPKTSFWPQPKVDSAIIRIVPLINADRKQINADLFFKIVRAGFSQPRKQLVNNLSKKLKLDKEKAKSWLLKNNIKPEQRAETLSIENWINLTKTLNDKK